ncbi:hypothetical protein [Streptomyces sp. IB2014 016-6]|uniref:hypothetical protein n=1 Tax=Streptomyces sp. IB2014 016-6 TaxID=2517818 RepID=UPI0011C848FF|nr:hypothetical protein [Streptomyces sp. IB2014 016-6]TXL85835.1 hypothetical protein EW053_29335 [Streptomyces sp. IB2014 016-6]
MERWRPGARADVASGGTDVRRLPLPVLPQFPGMRGFAELDSVIGRLGFRHAADLLRGPAVEAGTSVFATLPKATEDDGFRILDGLWFPARGRAWTRVDLRHIQETAERWRTSTDPRGGTAAALMDTMETVVRDDPMGPRRIVLWQVCRELKDRAGGPTAEAAEALGVHGADAAPLAAAVAAGFPGRGPVREAAESVNEVWPGERLREALRIACLLPSHPTDHVLANFLTRLNDRAAAVDRLMEEAGRLGQLGELRAATVSWLAAVRRATDDDRALAGLLGAAALLADERHSPAAPSPVDSTVRVSVERRAVTLRWTAARLPRDPARTGKGRGGPVSYRVLRFPDGAPEQAAEVPYTDGSLSVLDLDAPIGRRVRYAVLPLRRGRLAGVPRVTGAVLLVPDVAEVRAVPVPDGVRLEWRAHPAARGFRAVRSTARRAGGPDRAGQPVDGVPVDGLPVPAGRKGFVDRPLLPGTYLYEISCGYPVADLPGDDGELVWSPGVRVAATSVEWPSPVEEVTVRSLEGGTVTIDWRPPARGNGRLVEWPGLPMGSGEDVSGTAAARSAPGEGPVSVVPEARSRVRMTAVSVLGDRAVAGPSVLVERPGAVEDLTARRLAPGTAELRFRWPEPAVLVLVAWEQEGRRREMRVARSRYLAEGRVEIPLTGRPCRVEVSAVPRPDAVSIPAVPATTSLPHVPEPPPQPPRSSRALALLTFPWTPWGNGGAPRGRPWWRRRPHRSGS